MHALMLPQRRSFLIHNQPRTHANVLTQKRLGVAIGNEANIVGIRLLGHGKAHLTGFFTDLRLLGVTHWEHAPLDLLRAQHPEHVGLVFIWINGAAEVPIATVNGLGEPRVVPGSHGVETQRHTPF